MFPNSKVTYVLFHQIFNCIPFCPCLEEWVPANLPWQTYWWNWQGFGNHLLHSWIFIPRHLQYQYLFSSSIDLYCHRCVVCLNVFVHYYQVQGLIKKLVDEHFNSDMEAVMKDPILFGDYSNALAETEPRVYEDILDYDASKILFQVP